MYLNFQQYLSIVKNLVVRNYDSKILLSVKSSISRVLAYAISFGNHMSLIAFKYVYP